MMRQLVGFPERPGDLQEAETHQIGAERNAEINEPARYLEIGRGLIGAVETEDEFSAHRADDRREQSAAEQSEQDYDFAIRFIEVVDQNIDADMDAGANAIGGAEFRHPDQHVDAEFLRPRYVNVVQIGIKRMKPDAEAMHDRDENNQRRRGQQARNQNFFKTIENAEHERCEFF